MSIINSITSWLFDGLRRETGTQTPGPLTYPTESAEPVTFDSALQLSGVWACVKLLAETVASLPVGVYKMGENGRELADNHPIYRLLTKKPNKYQTKVEFFETLMLNLVIHGNAYCKIDRLGNEIVSLLPIMSSQVETVLLKDGTVVHEYYAESGVQVFASESIWHLKLMGNGIVGMSPLAYQRNTLGIAQAAERAVTKIYKNGAKPSGVLSMDRILTPAQRDQIRGSFNNLTVSTDDRLMVLEGGMKFDAISLSPQDIELLASRQFQLSEICRWYGVPSVLINDTSSTTVWGSGIEQLVAGFYKLTLRPLLEKIEASIDTNLIGGNKYFVEFDFNSLMRSDIKSRFESYRVGIQGGFLTPNEARDWEGLEAKPNGDKLFMQGATLPLDKLGYNQSQSQDNSPIGGDNDDAAQVSDAQ